MCATVASNHFPFEPKVPGSMRFVAAAAEEGSLLCIVAAQGAGYWKEPYYASAKVRQRS
jgi:hypothetical protein